MRADVKRSKGEKKLIRDEKMLPRAVDRKKDWEVSQLTMERRKAGE